MASLSNTQHPRWSSSWKRDLDPIPIFLKSLQLEFPIYWYTKNDTQEFPSFLLSLHRSICPSIYPTKICWGPMLYLPQGMCGTCQSSREYTLSPLMFSNDFLSSLCPILKEAAVLPEHCWFLLGKESFFLPITIVIPCNFSRCYQRLFFSFFFSILLLLLVTFKSTRKFMFWAPLQSFIIWRFTFYQVSPF